MCIRKNSFVSNVRQSQNLRILKILLHGAVNVVSVTRNASVVTKARRHSFGKKV